MSQVTTTCQKCEAAFQWFMGAGSEMPDCPECCFNPISSQRDSGVDKLLKDLQSSDDNVRNNEMGSNLDGLLPKSTQEFRPCFKYAPGHIVLCQMKWGQTLNCEFYLAKSI